MTKTNQLVLGLAIVAVSSAVALSAGRGILLSCVRNGSNPVAASAHLNEVTIVPTGSPADIQAIQAAVDDPAIDVVKLSGTFNFGPEDGVWITRAGVTVTGEGKDRPVINGGGAFRTVYINYGGTETWERHHRYVFGINAPGVTIRGLEFRGFDTEAIFVLGGSPDPRPVVIDDNVMNTENIAGMEELMSAAVGSHYTGGWPMRISNNKITGSTGGIVANWSGYYLNESGQDAYGGSPLEIVNNEITTDVPPDQLVDGIMVLGWNTFETIHSDPEWGDNGPVLITGNTVNYNDQSFGPGMAIGIGRSAMGLNHCLVANNTITGHGMAGIVKYSYGHDNQIVGNDLSGFAAWDGQIWVFAADTLVSKNILGLANEIEGYTSGIWVFATLVHPGLCPMPAPLENVMILNNDYTHISDASGRSAAGIWVASNADWEYCNVWDEAGDCTEMGWGLGNEARNNMIVEPAKSWGVKPADLAATLANQVYLQPSNGGEGPQMVYDNTIVGLNATKMDARPMVKDAKKMMEARNEMFKRMSKKMFKEGYK